MAKEHDVDTTSKGGQIIQSGSRDVFYLIGLVILGGYMYRSGYNLGLRVSKQVLKRHDKDVRMMEKKQKKYLKDLDKEKRGEEQKFKLWPW